MKIELGKHYRTRDGREVRIYAVDGGVAGDGVHGAIRDKDGVWYAYQWYPHGGYLSGLGDPRDLIEVKPRIQLKRWVNVYDDMHVSLAYETKQNADLWADWTVKRIACVEVCIDVEEGHGL